MKNRVLIVGAGKMGGNHIRTVRALAETRSDIEIAGIADRNPQRLAELIKNGAQETLYWLCRDVSMMQKFAFAHLTSEQQQQIKVCNHAGEAFVDTQANTLANLVNNNAHLSVLRDVLFHEGAETPHLIFQEKPFADLNEDITDVVRVCEEQGIVVAVNSVLMESAIWDVIRPAVDNIIDAKLVFVRSSYGKYRGDFNPELKTDDRLCLGGWVGMDGIHMLDIMMGLSVIDRVEISAEYLKAFRGHLNKYGTESGVTDYALYGSIVGIAADGRRIPMEIEGSFAHFPQTRRSQFGFLSGQMLEMHELLFDERKPDHPVEDVYRVRRFNLVTGQASEITERRVDADKLKAYYVRVLDGHAPSCDLDRARLLQVSLEQMGRPGHIEELDAVSAPHACTFPGIEELTTQELLSVLKARNVISPEYPSLGAPDIQ